MHLLNDFKKNNQMRTLNEVFIAKPLHILSSKSSNFLFETVIGRQLPLYFRHQAFIAFCTKIRHRTALELDRKPAQPEMPDWAARQKLSSDNLCSDIL